MKRNLLALTLAMMLVAVTVMPVLADTPGIGNSDLIIQNTDDSEATVTVDYYDSSGANDQLGGAPVAIPWRGSHIYEAGTLPVGDGWSGSAVISTDRRVATVTRLAWQSTFGSADDKATGGSIAGTSGPGTDLYFPYATVKPVGGIPGKLNRFSIVMVQNAGLEDTDIDLYFYNQTDGSLTMLIEDDLILMGRTKSYNLSDLLSLEGNWQGSVYVHSDDQPIAGVVTTHWAVQVWSQWASAYGGASSGSTALYGPSISRVDKRDDPSVGSWVRSSNILVQNVGNSTANVTLQLFATGSSTAAMTITTTIAPKAMGEFNTRFGSPTDPSYPASAFETALGKDFKGSVKITCTNGRPLAGVVHSFWHLSNENAASTYQTEPAGATDIYVPYAPRKKSGGNWVEWSKTAVQNLSGSTANITLTFRNQDGSLALRIYDSITGNSGNGYNTRHGIDSIPGSAYLFAPLGDNFAGTLRIESTQPIVAVVNLSSKPNLSSTYNTFIPD